MREWLYRYRMPAFLVLAAAVHLAAFAWIRFAIPAKETAFDPEAAVFKLVDVEEYVPPPPETAVRKVMEQPKAAENVVETKETVVEVKDESAFIVPAEPDYLPQHKISDVPSIPTKAILDRIEYPPIPLRQGIEGVVYLELFIDETGSIRKVNILKDPGFGFAEAALKAMEGIRCEPAKANGKAVAVRFRYPVRFSLK